MRRLKIAAGLFVFASIAFWFGFSMFNRQPEAIAVDGFVADVSKLDGGNATQYPGVTRAQDAARAVPIRESTREGEGGRSSQIKKYICEVNSQFHEECVASLVGAASEQEADWLIRSGYPTPNQLRDVDSNAINLIALEIDAKAGDLIAKGLLGRSYVNAGKPQEAFSVLSDAVAKGSVFAVHEMARVYAAKDFPSNDIHESAAYVRAAYLLGDVRASRKMYLSYPSFGSVEFALADKRGYEIYLGMLKLRARNGVPGTVVRPL